MIFDIINSIARAFLTMIIVYKLIRFHDMMITPERIGLGLMASGSIMTVPVIWEHRQSPFDGWAVSVMTVGAVVFLLGRTWRDRRHQRANDQMARMAGQWRHDRSRG